MIRGIKIWQQCSIHLSEVGTPWGVKRLGVIAACSALAIALLPPNTALSLEADPGSGADLNLELVDFQVDRESQSASLEFCYSGAVSARAYVYYGVGADRSGGLTPTRSGSTGYTQGESLCERLIYEWDATMPAGYLQLDSITLQGPGMFPASVTYSRGAWRVNLETFRMEWVPLQRCEAIENRCKGESGALADSFNHKVWLGAKTKPRIDPLAWQITPFLFQGVWFLNAPQLLDSDGGLPTILQLEYRRHRQSSPWTSVDTSQSDATRFPELPPGSYDLRISASNELGQSATTYVNPRLMRGLVYPTPGLVYVAATPMNRQIDVSWKMSRNRVPGGLTRFRAVAQPGGAFCTASPRASACAIKGLKNGVRYTVSVHPESASDAYAVVDAPETAKPAKRKLSPGPVKRLRYRDRNTTFRVTWRPPDFQGSKRITGYEYRVDEGRWHSTKRPTASISGVTKEQRVAIEVRAKNRFGSGPTISLVRRGP